MTLSLYEIKPNIQIVDNKPILYLQDIDAIVAADLHLGVEAIMQEDGSYVPLNLTSQVIATLSNCLNELKPSKLILNGDVKHSFFQPTKIENRDVKNILKEISRFAPEIHIIKGNHDVFLSWVAQDFARSSNVRTISRSGIGCR